MNSEFNTYLRLGFSHIADVRAGDHIVFVVALTAGYAPRAWSQLLWLVTAFTLGHSVTLALATLNVVRVPVALVETLIALTIVLTGLAGLAFAIRRDAAAAELGSRRRLLYAFAGGFGLIHGLGFSSFLRSVLGAEERIALPLLAFNVGLEAGQMLIVLAVLLAGAVVCDVFGVSRHRWSMGLAVVTTLLGLAMLVERA